MCKTLQMTLCNAVTSYFFFTAAICESGETEQRLIYGSGSFDLYYIGPESGEVFVHYRQ